MVVKTSVSFVPDLDSWVGEVIIDDAYDAMIQLENDTVYLLRYKDNGEVLKFDYSKFQTGVDEVITKLKRTK